MKLIEVARAQRDLLNDGIAFIAIWQQTAANGRASWFSEDIFPDGELGRASRWFDDEQKSRLAEIAALDENAILLNGYIHSWIGSADEPLNAATIAIGIENHYTMHNALIRDYLAGAQPRLTREVCATIPRQTLSLSCRIVHQTQGAQQRR